MYDSMNQNNSRIQEEESRLSREGDFLVKAEVELKGLTTRHQSLGQTIQSSIERRNDLQVN